MLRPSFVRKSVAGSSSYHWWSGAKVLAQGEAMADAVTGMTVKPRSRARRDVPIFESSDGYSPFAIALAPSATSFGLHLAKDYRISLIR